MKILLRSSKKKLGIKLPSSGRSNRKLFTVREMKRLGYLAFRKVVSSVLMSLLKIGRDALSSVKSAHNTIFFLFGGNL